MSKERVDDPLAIAVAPAATGDLPSAPASSRKHREQQMRPHVQYVGCRIADDGREYTLRAPSKSSRLFVFFIAHEHFAAGEARFQDGPDLCCAKLTRVLTDDAGEPPSDGRLEFTTEELLEYRESRATPERKRSRRRADAA
jgi:hypothetical protein